VVGVLITFSPEFAKALGVQGAISAGNAVMYCYIGLVAGDLASGLLSQLFRSRKKVVLLFLLLTVAAVAVYFMAHGIGAAGFYAICGALGFGIGYWAIFVTVAAEQFGTNLRATVATTVPNFVRGMTVPITMLFQFFRQSLGLQGGALAVGSLCLVIALISLWQLEETFHKDLDYFEEFL
jgi:MFS family permease